MCLRAYNMHASKAVPPLLCLQLLALAGIQFWVTKFIIDVIGKDQESVTPAFGATSIAAPLLGVFAGGAFIVRDAPVELWSNSLDEPLPRFCIWLCAPTPGILSSRIRLELLA